MTRILEAQKSAPSRRNSGGAAGTRSRPRRRAARDALDARGEDQKEQYDYDTKYIQKRLGELEKELASEPARIRDLYDVKHHRLERVGLVYLWPTTA